MRGGATLLMLLPSPDGFELVGGGGLLPGAATTLMRSPPEGTTLPIPVSSVFDVSPPAGVSAPPAPPADSVATSVGGAALAVWAAWVVVAACWAAEKPGSRCAAAWNAWEAAPK